jgi:hypothetical protein
MSNKNKTELKLSKVKFGWWYFDYLLRAYDENMLIDHSRYDCFDVFEREYKKQINDFAGLIDEIIPAYADSGWENGILFKIADKIFGIFHKAGLIKDLTR